MLRDHLSKLSICLTIVGVLASCKLSDDKLYGSIGEALPDSSPSQSPSSYCAQGNRLTNTPYANSGESGTDGLSEETAYTICSPAQLNAIGVNTADRDKYFILKTDLDMSALGSTSYNIIGDIIGNTFTGTFNGEGYVISNLKVSGIGYVGLFGIVDGATIKGVGLKNISLRGSGSMGALVGSASDVLVENCFATGVAAHTGSFYAGGLVGSVATITLRDSFSLVNIVSTSISSTAVGGLVGTIGSSGVISNSFAIGNLTSTRTGGGLVGTGSSVTITDSFFIGSVEGSSPSDSVGMVGGILNSSTVNNTYYDDQKACNNLGAGNCNTLYGSAVDTSLDNDYFFTVTNAPMDQWDFVNTWEPVAGGPPQLASLDALPMSEYCWEAGRHQNLPFANSGEAGIDGSSALVAYTVCSADQMNQIGSSSANWSNLYYSQMDAVNLGHLTGTSYNIIGTGSGVNSFSNSSFNGNQQGIHNLTYTDSTASYVGLFGYVSGTSILRNIRMINSNISGTSYIGSLVGYFSGDTLERSSATGVVTASGATQTYVGGLMGFGAGNLQDLYSDVDITATAGHSHGGLVGVLFSSTSMAYSLGTVSSTGDKVGGFVGDCSLSGLLDVFALGNVQGDSASNDVGPVSGEPCASIFGNVYHNSAATCANLSGTCSSDGAGVDLSANPGYFYESIHFSMNWDFVSIWQEVEDGYPTHRSP